jgi:hypothetical protein
MSDDSDSDYDSDEEDDDEEVGEFLLKDKCVRERVTVGSWAGLGSVCVNGLPHLIIS